MTYVEIIPGEDIIPEDEKIIAELTQEEIPKEKKLPGETEEEFLLNLIEEPEEPEKKTFWLFRIFKKR